MGRKLCLVCKSYGEHSLDPGFVNFLFTCLLALRYLMFEQENRDNG